MAQEIETKSDIATSVLPPSSKMTYDEFLAWADESVRVEWVDGDVVIMSPPTARHQNVLVFLGALLRCFVEAKNAGLVILAPFQMKLEARPSGREPDVLFIARERLNLLTNTYLNGAADLAVEIISPESRARDRSDKFHEYQQAGVREYWLIDPTRNEAEFYRLNADGIYHPAPTEAGIFRSVVLEGLWLKVDWLWQEPLPALLSVLKEWKLI